MTTTSLKTQAICMNALDFGAREALLGFFAAACLALVIALVIALFLRPLP